MTFKRWAILAALAVVTTVVGGFAAPSPSSQAHPGAAARQLSGGTVLTRAGSKTPSRRGSTTTGSGFSASSVSAYEWYDSTWSSGASSYRPRLATLKRLGVTELFVDITRAVTMEQGSDAALKPYLSTFRELVAYAARENVRVHALMGDPCWATSDHAGAADALKVMSDLKALKVGSMPAGLQLDVEPWGLPAWSNEKSSYSLAYLSMVRSVAKSWQTLALPGSLGFAVPYWFNGAGGSVPPVDSGNGLVDPLTALLGILGSVRGSYLNLMTYMTDPSAPGGTIDSFRSDLVVAKRLGSPVTLLLGQELGEDPSEATTTFYGSDWATWTANVAKLRASFASTPHYGGLAVDDTEAMEQLSRA